MRRLAFKKKEGTSEGRCTRDVILGTITVDVALIKPTFACRFVPACASSHLLLSTGKQARVLAE